MGFPGAHHVLRQPIEFSDELGWEHNQVGVPTVKTIRMASILLVVRIVPCLRQNAPNLLVCSLQYVPRLCGPPYPSENSRFEKETAIDDREAVIVSGKV